MKTWLGAIAIWLLVAFCGFSWAAERLKYGTFSKDHPVVYLPMLAAEERGFWKDNGLEAEWMAFRGSAEMMQGVAAGELTLGLSTAVSVIQAAARGIPIMAVSEFHLKDYFIVWVPGQSPVRSPADLKGTKLGITRIGGTDYAYMKMVLKSLQLEKDVRLVTMGGIPESLAMLRTGVVDGFIRSVYVMAKLKAAGEVRQLLVLDDYLPKEWLVHVIFASRESARAKPDMVKRAIRASLQAANFVGANQAWALAKIQKEQGFSEEVAKVIYQHLEFTKTGKMKRAGLENVRNFLIEYGIVPKEKAPPLEEVYTAEFTG